MLPIVLSPCFGAPQACVIEARVLHNYSSAEEDCNPSLATASVDTEMHNNDLALQANELDAASSNLADLYFKDTLRFPLLNRATEIAYAVRIEACLQNLLKRMAPYPSLFDGLLADLKAVLEARLPIGQVLDGWCLETLKNPGTPKAFQSDLLLTQLKTQLPALLAAHHAAQTALNTGGRLHPKTQAAFLAFGNTLAPFKLTDEVLDGLIERLQEVMTSLELRGLLEARQRLKDAKHQLVQANLRWVLSLARKQSALVGVAYLDLVQAGNIGLIKAVNRFDWRFKARFSTYATYWISEAIQQCVEQQSRLIRLPSHVQTLLGQLKPWIAQQQQTNQVPSVEALSAFTQQSVSQMKAAIHHPTTVSAQTLVGEEGDALEQLLEDVTSPSPFEAASQQQLQQRLKSLLKTLKPRQCYVLMHRFGLTETGECQTLTAIGKALCLTREAVRQLEKRALEKLKGSEEVHLLASFLH